MRGLFITLEGGDGAGKTTQAELLEDWLVSRGREVVRTREPGGTPLGKQLRELLLHGESVDPRAEALLYAADRAQHIAEVVRPALERGAVVVQDRYIDSSLAYQGAGRVLDQSEIRHISAWASRDLWPELTVLLDVSVEVSARRRAQRGKAADRLESEAREFHHAVREGFRGLAEAEPTRFLVVDAGRATQDIHDTIVTRVVNLIS
ncbi:MAG: dTMP kinase [Leucobacter sp.]